MSLMQLLLGTVAKLAPDRPGDKLLDGPGYIGQPIDRADASPKVQGQAKFAAEFELDGLVHASIVCSDIARGKIESFDLAAATALPGVLAILTHENVPKLTDPPLFDTQGSTSGAAGSSHPILQGPDITYDGEPVAVVVAETLEVAEHAASLIRVHYHRQPARTDFEAELPKAETPSDVLGEPAEVRVGEAEIELGRAAYRVDSRYSTPPYNHVAIEPHASTAFWSEDGSSLVCLESSQMVQGFKNTLAKVFSLDPSKVRVLSPFVGGGFGSKALWANSVLCALAAKTVGRPVRMMLTREQVFRTVGGRTPSRQPGRFACDGSLAPLMWAEFSTPRPPQVSCGEG